MAQSTFPLNSPDTVTQILYLEVSIHRIINSTSNIYGQLWSSILTKLEQSPGFQRLYWGRSREQPQHVQLHVVRETLEQHHQALDSATHDAILPLLRMVCTAGPQGPIRAVRHVALAEQTPGCRALGRGAPFTGTAIYLRPTAAWDDGAWPLWTHVVRHVDGCLGCAGGTLLEPVELLGEPVVFDGATADADGTWEGYLVYVGWASVEQHEEYHHTKHFDKHRVILRCGNVGFAEYGHVVFEEMRERGVDEAKL